MVSYLLADFFLFLFGASIGSFLNVLIDRLPRGEQVFKGRSYCDRCKHKLSWSDLFPIFSWFILGARCRFCHSPISIQYPLVEGVTGFLFVMAFYLLPRENISDLLFISYDLLIISSLVVIFVADLKYQIIPDKIVYPMTVLTFTFQIINQRSEITNIINPLLSAVGAGLFFFAIVLVTRGRGMGFGDVKLGALMGLVLGFPKIIVALYLAFLTGAFFGVILILWGKKRFGEHLPFGPFLSGATFISLFWGQILWQVFQKILGLP